MAQEKIEKKTITEQKVMPEPQQKPNARYLRDKDREKVRGKFIFHDIPGGTLRFCIRLWKEDPVEFYALTDGEVYELPLGVARHINKNMWYPEYEYMPGLGGDTGQKIVGARNPFSSRNNTMRIAKKIRRATFHSLDFVDIDDVNPVGTPAISEVVTVF